MLISQSVISVHPRIAGGENLLLAAASLPFTIGIGSQPLSRDDIGDSDDEITDDQLFNRQLVSAFVNQTPLCGACMPWPEI